MSEREMAEPSRQSIRLHRTLEEKKRLRELMQTNPEEAIKIIQERLYQSRHRPQGISSSNSQKARRFKKVHCESCGATEHLLVHHKNHNQSDNDPDNLETLCSSCHHIAHHLRKKKPWEMRE